MSPYYEIINPSNHIIVEKGSELNFLIEENKQLKLSNNVIVGVTILATLILIIYASSQPKKEER
jgi:hypothetical protein